MTVTFALGGLGEVVDRRRDAADRATRRVATAASPARHADGAAVRPAVHRVRRLEPRLARAACLISPPALATGCRSRRSRRRAAGRGLGPGQDARSATSGVSRNSWLLVRMAQVELFGAAESTSPSESMNTHWRAHGLGNAGAPRRQDPESGSRCGCTAVRRA